MWIIFVLAGYAVVAAALALWSARVCFRSDTKPAVRLVAYKIFRTAWVTGVTSVVSGAMTAVLKLHEAGVI